MNTNQKITPTTISSNEDQLKQINKRIEQKIKSKEQELLNVKNTYDDKIENTKLDGEKKYIQALDKNQEQLLNESHNYEEKISSYKDRLKETQNKIDKEREILQSNHSQRMEELRANHSDILAANNESLIDSQKSIERNNQDTFINLAHKHHSTKDKMESDLNRNIQSLSIDHVNTLSDVKQKQKNEQRYHIAKTNTELSTLKKDLAQELNKEVSKTTRLNNEQKRVHMDNLTFQEKYQQDLLLQKDEDFKVRYQNLVDSHNESIKNISQQLQKDLQRIVERKSKNLEVTSKQGEDPFYSVSLIRPKITEGEKEIFVAIAVSEYEKDNLLLSTQGRNIKLTLSRKYADAITDKDGSSNKTTRSELYSKEFKTKDILNSNNITQSYQDGILTFKILKA